MSEAGSTARFRGADSVAHEPWVAPNRTTDWYARTGAYVTTRSPVRVVALWRG